MELVLDGCCLAENDIRAMVTAFPKLESMTYRVESSEYADDAATTSYVVAALATAYKTCLRALHMDWTEANYEMDYWDDGDASLAGIKGLTALTKLVLADPFLHRSPAQPVTDKVFWESILAPNLSSIEFRVLSKNAWNVLPLVAAVKEKCGNKPR